MARFSRLEVYNTMLDQGLVPIFYHGDVEVTGQVIRACAAAGGRVFEFTNRGDQAIDVFKAVIRCCAEETPDMIIGAGTIYDAPTAALYVANGANFVVGPVFSEEVARFCNRRKIPYVPGCATATEISRAEEFGAEIVKVFPGESVGGPDFVKALLGPSPWTRIMPTGGVEATRDCLQPWFRAGVAAVGIGGNMLRKEYLAGKNYEGITAKTAEVLGWIRELRA